MDNCRELTQAAAAGDKMSYYVLYAESFRKIYSTVIGITGERESAKELAAQTYILSYRKLSMLQYPDAFEIWIDSLARMLALHYLKQRDPERASKEIFLQENGLADANAQELYSPDAATASEVWNIVLSRIDEGAAAAAGHASTAARAAHAADPGSSPEERSSAKKPFLLPYEPSEEEIAQLAASAKPKRIRRIYDIPKRTRALAAAALVIALCGTGIGIKIGLNKRTPTKEILDSTDPAVSKVADVGTLLSSELGGQLGEIYELEDGVYYMVIYLGDESSGTVVRYDIQNGNINIMGSDNPIEEDKIEETDFEADENEYMQINFSGIGHGKIRSFDEAYSELIAEADETQLDAQDNTLNMDPLLLEQARKKADDKKSELADSLDAQTSGDFSLILRIRCTKVDLSKPVCITLDSGISDAIGDAGEIQIIVNDNQHCIGISRDQMTKLADKYGSVSLYFASEGSKSYIIRFFDSSGNTIPELYGNMDFSFPADSPLTYVKADYGSSSENRGGIYSESAKTITFPVSLSGTYTLIGNEIKLKDVSKTDPETAKAAAFIASLGFIKADDKGYFRPDEGISRGEFAEAISRMFLEISSNPNADISDIDSSSDDYLYIAAGFESDILDGYGSGSFEANKLASREEIFTMSARTLAHKGGYEYPSNASYYLKFDDENELSNYSKAPLALLVREKFITGSGNFEPKRSATRGEAALILFKLYTALFDQ